MSTTLNEIKAITRTEKEKSGLQELEDDFYTRVEARLSELYEKRDEKIAEVDNPFQCTEIKQTSDRIESIEDEIQSLHRLRSAKILDKAGFVAAGMGNKPSGTTPAEQDMFEGLVAELTTGKQQVLNAIDPDKNDTCMGATSGKRDSTKQTQSQSKSNNSMPHDASQPAISIDGGKFSTTTNNNEDDETGMLVEAQQGGNDDLEEVKEEDVNESNNGNNENIERITVKMKKSVGEILGADEREYELQEDDVVTLPEKNASPLINKEAAEPIDTQTE